MVQKLNRLSARRVHSLGKEGVKPGWYGDGGGLYLRAGPGNARRWIFVFRWRGKRAEMGLGGLASVTLASARLRAVNARILLAQGQNPIEVRKTEEAARQAAITFGTFADSLVADISQEFRNAKHAAQWEMTLTKYAAPIRDKNIADITTDDVLGVLKPLWQSKQDTASRLRGRIERVLDAAKARGLRDRENPARWRGHLKHLLPPRQKLARGHLRALPFQEVPALMDRLRALGGVTALALEFLILSAARTKEVRFATWSEIDREGRAWIIPAVKTKTGKPRRVPLTDRMLAILTEIEQVRVNEFVFPGERRRQSGLSENMLIKLLNKHLEVDKAAATVHGFRSSFRDWAAEQTVFPREIIELALGHKVVGEVEGAYWRSDVLERRRQLMTAWDRYCSTTPEERVVNISDYRAG
jgi:integrase